MTNILLNPGEQQDYLTRHLRHRLTLLRCLRECRDRRIEKFAGRGDIYRCVKDSNLIAVRLLMDFLGLKGEIAGNSVKLVAKSRPSSAKAGDDIYIEHFGLPRVDPSLVLPPLNDILAGVYVRGDKELAHLTRRFLDLYNTDEILIDAATEIERLMKQHLYDPLNCPLPLID